MGLCICTSITGHGTLLLGIHDTTTISHGHWPGLWRQGVLDAILIGWYKCKYKLLMPWHSAKVYFFWSFSVFQSDDSRQVHCMQLLIYLCLGKIDSHDRMTQAPGAGTKICIDDRMTQAPGVREPHCTSQSIITLSYNFGNSPGQ